MKVVQVINPCDTHAILNELKPRGRWSAAWIMLLNYLKEHQPNYKRLSTKFRVSKIEFVNCGLVKSQLFPRSAAPKITISSRRYRVNKINYWTKDCHHISVGFEQHFDCDEFIKLDDEILYWLCKQYQSERKPTPGTVYPENTYDPYIAENAMVDNKLNYLIAVGLGINAMWDWMSPFDPYGEYTVNAPVEQQRIKIEQNIKSLNWHKTIFDNKLTNRLEQA